MAVSISSADVLIECIADSFIGREERGIVVSIYLDPDNEQGSTSNTLYSLEWTSASILR